MADISATSDLSKQLQALSARVVTVEKAAAANLAAQIKSTVKMIAALLSSPYTSAQAAIYVSDPSVAAIAGMLTGDVNAILNEATTAALALQLQISMGLLSLQGITLPAFSVSLSASFSASLTVNLGAAQAALAAGIAAGLTADAIAELQATVNQLQNALDSAESVITAINRIAIGGTISAHFSAGATAGVSVGVSA